MGAWNHAKPPAAWTRSSCGPWRAPSRARRLPELALHVAGCAACQARLLAADLPERQARASGPRAVPRSLGALLTRALLVLAAILLALYSIQRLLG